jgi:hypothetical protein
MRNELLLTAPSWPARRRKPPKQTTVTIITADAAVRADRVDGEGVVVEAVRAARPDVRNVAVDLGSIRWTDPKTARRVTFNTPITVRDALLGSVATFRGLSWVRYDRRWV